MANYREIVTKAVIAKGKKLFTTKDSINCTNRPSKILGVWIVNHNFDGVRENEKIKIEGSYDINIWYSYDNDTKTEVLRQTNKYNEVIKMRDSGSNTLDKEVVVRCLKQPNCAKIDIDEENINYVVEKELGVELLGDIKLKVEASEEDPWDEIGEESNLKDIENIDENYLE